MDSSNAPRQFSQRVVPNLLIATAVLLALWGLMVVVGLFTEIELMLRLAHFPFWLTIGLIGVVLNYLPLAKSKPGLIPKLGILATAGTALWFCFNNFFELKDLVAFGERLRLDAILMLVCYCLTHMSLLLLTYRKGHRNSMLIVTMAIVGISGIAYLTLLSGVFGESIDVMAIFVASATFFIKFAMTMIVVIQHLSRREIKVPPKIQPTNADEIVFED